MAKLILLTLACLLLVALISEEANASCASVQMKPGCPAPNPLEKCSKCEDKCLKNADCGTNKLCCPKPGCGNWCTEPKDKPAKKGPL